MVSGGKIKGWKKQQERGASSHGKDIPAKWTNVADDRSKSTTVLLGTKRVKIVQSKKGRGQKKIYSKADFKTQGKARKKAMSYMRKNPNP